MGVQDVQGHKEELIPSAHPKQHQLQEEEGGKGKVKERYGRTRKERQKDEEKKEGRKKKEEEEEEEEKKEGKTERKTERLTLEL